MAHLEEFEYKILLLIDGVEINVLDWDMTSDPKQDTIEDIKPDASRESYF